MLRAAGLEDTSFDADRTLAPLPDASQARCSVDARGVQEDEHTAKGS
jgi:hypothetical protein